MHYAAALLALAATAIAQGPGGAVTDAVAPEGSSPPGCQETFNGGSTFTFTTRNLTSSSKRSIEERAVACGGEGSLTLTLNNGVLLDGKGRTGYIASNRQFQFDGPPQAGAIYTAGFSVCGNQSLALGDSAIFYNCLSGTFKNIYDQSQGGQCYPVTIETFACVSSSAPVTLASSQPTVSGASSTTENIMSEMMNSLPATSAPAPTSAIPPISSVGSFTPIVNSTAPAATGTGATPTTIAPTSSPSPFTGAGATVAAGQKILGLAAAGAAMALF
ncbi:MAG: hypothetical protein Q9217_004172 [Psora testacea]